MGICTKILGDLDMSSRNFLQRNESKENHTQEENMSPHSPIGCFTMLPNPSNSKAARTAACQRNQMQPVEKHLPKFDVWVLGVPSKQEGKKGGVVQCGDLK